jgi:hypothetical protein
MGHSRQTHFAPKRRYDGNPLKADIVFRDLRAGGA